MGKDKVENLFLEKLKSNQISRLWPVNFEKDLNHDQKLINIKAYEILKTKFLEEEKEL